MLRSYLPVAATKTFFIQRSSSCNTYVTVPLVIPSSKCRRAPYPQPHRHSEKKNHRTYRCPPFSTIAADKVFIPRLARGVPSALLLPRSWLSLRSMVTTFAGNRSRRTHSFPQLTRAPSSCMLLFIGFSANTW